MSHYSTLQDYRFEPAAEDLRGAKLYGEGGEELARIRDVVFDHESGDIHYLVAEYGHDRSVLVPMNRVFRSVVDEDSLSSDLTGDDLDRLPAFDDKMLNDSKRWRAYGKLHRATLEERRKQSREEYRHGWTESPVQHANDDVAHNITPVDVEPAGVAPMGRGDEYVPDLWPQRMAPVFGQAENTSDKLNMVPQAEGSRAPDAEYISAGLGPKWNGFAERIRRDLHHLRGTCSTCRNLERAA